MSRWSGAVVRFAREDSGASMVEYSLMLALVAAACVTAVTTFGAAVSRTLGSATGSI